MLAIHANDNRVFAVLELACHVKNKGGKAALMNPDFLAVQIDRRLVIGRAKMQKIALACFGLCVKTFAQPN